MSARHRALRGLVAQHEPIAVHDEGILLQHQLRQSPLARGNAATG